jgi:tripartite-type tricarboxylate transporter receptor subunit TctC
LGSQQLTIVVPSGEGGGISQRARRMHRALGKELVKLKSDVKTIIGNLMKVQAQGNEE